MKRALIQLLSVALVVAAIGSNAWAQRAAKTTVKNGVRTTQWEANGVRFKHKTYGNSKIGWERHATAKDAQGRDKVTVIKGKVWGNKIEGEEAHQGGQSLSWVKATAPDGTTRTTTTFRNVKGTERKGIDMSDKNRVRKITTWKVGATEMKDTRDYDKSTGKLLERKRTGTKAQ